MADVWEGINFEKFNSEDMFEVLDLKLFEDEVALTTTW